MDPYRAQPAVPSASEIERDGEGAHVGIALAAIGALTTALAASSDGATGTIIGISVTCLGARTLWLALRAASRNR